MMMISIDFENFLETQLVCTLFHAILLTPYVLKALYENDRK